MDRSRRDYLTRRRSFFQFALDKRISFGGNVDGRGDQVIRFRAVIAAIDRELGEDGS